MTPSNPPGAGCTVGVPKETAEGERRVALVPKVIERLRGKGLEIVVESGAGEQALLPDSAYTDAGATIGDPWQADVVVKVNPPSDDEIAKLSKGSTLIGFLAPLTRKETIEALADAGVTSFAMESIPRISRAQSMDALSSQANVSGYKYVLRAAELSTRFFPMLTTAAGTVKPATALILGVGVAGLQALECPLLPTLSRGRGHATDPRPSARCPRGRRRARRSRPAAQRRATTKTAALPVPTKKPTGQSVS